MPDKNILSVEEFEALKAQGETSEQENQPTGGTQPTGGAQPTGGNQGQPKQFLSIEEFEALGKTKGATGDDATVVPQPVSGGTESVSAPGSSESPVMKVNHPSLELFQEAEGDFWQKEGKIGEALNTFY